MPPPPPPMNCANYPLPQHIVVATAKNTVLIPTTPFLDASNHPGLAPPAYGNDISFGVGGTAPHGQSVGKTEAVSKPKMMKLVALFAAGDSSGMAKRMFTRQPVWWQLQRQFGYAPLVTRIVVRTTLEAPAI